MGAAHCSGDAVHEGRSSIHGGVCSYRKHESWAHPSNLLPCSPSRLPVLHVCLSCMSVWLWLWSWCVRAGWEGLWLDVANFCYLSLSICPVLPPQADLCSPSDLLRGTTQGLQTILEAVTLAGGKAALPVQPSSDLGGFLLFYMVSMLLLYVVYTRLLGS